MEAPRTWSVCKMKKFKVWVPVNAYIVKIVEADNLDEAVDKATFPIWSPEDFDYDGGRIHFGKDPDVGGWDAEEIEE